MNWRCGSSIRAPALQAQSPEFKPQLVWWDKPVISSFRRLSQGAESWTSLDYIARHCLKKKKKDLAVFYLTPSTRNSCSLKARFKYLRVYYGLLSTLFNLSSYCGR
jgi:hypothetical protein